MGLWERPVSVPPLLFNSLGKKRQDLSKEVSYLATVKLNKEVNWA
jgi:hypothetical protein